MLEVLVDIKLSYGMFSFCFEGVYKLSERRFRGNLSIRKIKFSVFRRGINIFYIRKDVRRV